MSKKEGMKRRIAHFITIRQTFTRVTLGANIVALVLLWLVCATVYLPPSQYGMLSVLGLFFPIILVLNLIFLFLWLFVNWRFLFVPVLGIAVVWNFVMDYSPVRLGGRNAPGRIKVVTWNVCNFQRAKENSDELLRQIKDWDAQLLVFQEKYGGSVMVRVDSLTSAMKYNKAADEGRAVYSRYPILKSWSHRVPSVNSNGIFVVEILMDGDTVDVVNCHLESNIINSKDKADSRDAIVHREGRKAARKARTLWGKLGRAAQVRCKQVDRLTQLLDSLPANRRVIVCGDFNDTPISYAYHQVDKRLESAYRQAGRGVGVSYNERFFLFRIDHLFHSKHWITRTADVLPRNPYSDHNPLVVTLDKK